MKDEYRYLLGLWAKKPHDGSMKMLSLYVHLFDCAAMAKKVWRFRISKGVKQFLAQACGTDIRGAEKVYIFLCAVHDLGKATPVFQSKNSAYKANDNDRLIFEKILYLGLPLMDNELYVNRSSVPHGLAGEKILRSLGCNPSIAAIVGSHHGRPAEQGQLRDSIDAFSELFGKNTAWENAQHEAISFALGISDFERLEDLPCPNQPAQVIFSALVIMADWLSSNENAFPYMEYGVMLDSDELKARADDAWEFFGLQAPAPRDELWRETDLYFDRFGYNPNTMQSVVEDCLKAEKPPRMLVIEAPTGQGKTEAALVAAEIMQNRTGRTGLFFALPTQATTNAVFPRLLSWMERLMPFDRYAVKLAHGKAQFNEEYAQLPVGGSDIGRDEPNEGAMINTWFEGGKRSLLADFVVGTVDQLLLMALKQKHVMLRHFGLTDKVVVVDECHAFDAYMSEYLLRALSWLGAYKTPVIIMSATIPPQKKREMIAAYLGSKGFETTHDPDCLSTYPMITSVSENGVFERGVPQAGAEKTVEIIKIDEQDIAGYLDGLLVDGGCVGIVVNTVKKAQQLYEKLCGFYGDDIVRLIHSRFLAEDRVQNETELIEELGKRSSRRPYRRIVVGTQVLEQSLDIDFDLLITEVCPMDMLVQRMGRLHRHVRKRPALLQNPCCAVLNDDVKDSGSKSIYGECILMRTRALLPDRIVSPCDIPGLINKAYDFDYTPDNLSDEYPLALEKQREETAQRQRRADTFRMNKPSLKEGKTITGWLNTDFPYSEQRSEAAVRDGDESIEVLLLQKRNGRLCFLPWRGTDNELDQTVLSYDQAGRVARQCIKLPPIMCKKYAIDSTISELEGLGAEIPETWRKSPWLSGQLFLILDENLSCKLNGYELVYDRFIGLTYKKEDKE